MSRNNRGFTVVEMIIAISVSFILVGVLFTVTFRFFTNAVQSQQTAELALESQTLLSQMIEDLRLSAGISATNVLSDAYAPSGGWQTSNPNNVFIITTPAVNASRDILYDENTGFPHQNEIIYFVSNRTMYKRTLKNPVPPDSTARTTCPLANATAACPEDRIFSTNVEDITYTMYDFDSNVVTDPALARSVSLTVQMSKKVYGKTLSLSNTMRVTQRNL